MPHAEYGLYACPICGFLDEELNHNFTEASPAELDPDPLGFSSRAHLDPDPGAYRQYKRQYKMGSSNPKRYRPEVEERLNEKWKTRQDIPAAAHWGVKDEPETGVYDDPKRERRTPRPQPSPPGVVDARRLLGFTDEMTQQEMKGQFRKLLKENHPDVSKDVDAASKTIAIHDAYSLLKDRGIAE